MTCTPGNRQKTSLWPEQRAETVNLPQLLSPPLGGKKKPESAYQDRYSQIRENLGKSSLPKRRFQHSLVTLHVAKLSHVCDSSSGENESEY